MSESPLFSLKSHRLRICLLLMLGLYVSTSMRISIGMAITCMVNSTAFLKPEDTLQLPPSETNLTISNLTSADSTCRRIADPKTVIEDGYGGYLLWSPSMQGLLFSASFYGALFTTTISGYLADRFGPKMILFFALINGAVMSALGPFLSETSYWAYFGSRIVLGMGEGFVIPSMNTLASRWFPPNEKSTAGAIYTAGNQFAAGFTSLIVAALCTSALGSGAIFYILALLGFVWAVAWTIFASNFPSDNRWLSLSEEEYIERKLASKKQSRAFLENKVPWRQLLMGRATVAVYGCQFAFNFSITLLQSFLPTFLKDHLMLPIHLNGAYNMVPFLSQFVFKIPLAILSDSLKRRKLVEPDKMVKIFQTLASYGCAVSLFLLVTVPSCRQPYLALPILIVHGLSFSFAVAGFFTSMLSIAPPYTGTMTSIGRSYATIANISGSLFFSFIEYMHWPNKWIIIFSIAASLHAISGTYFLFNGQVQIQPWVYPIKTNVEGKEKEMNKT